MENLWKPGGVGFRLSPLGKISRPVRGAAPPQPQLGRWAQESASGTSDVCRRCLSTVPDRQRHAPTPEFGCRKPPHLCRLDQQQQAARTAGRCLRPISACEMSCRCIGVAEMNSHPETQLRGSLGSFSRSARTERLPAHLRSLVLVKMQSCCVCAL